MPNRAMKLYDNYEISPCRKYEEPDSTGKFYFEVCEPDEADVWTLYGHVSGEGVEAIGDFATREATVRVFTRITGVPFTGGYEADPRLQVMRAGPQLLEALTGLLDAIGGLPITILDGPAYEAMHRANAAVAKARSQS